MDFSLELPQMATGLQTPRSPSAASFVSDADSETGILGGGSVRCDIMAKFLRQRQLEKTWSDSNQEEGVVLKRAKDDFICQPRELSEMPGGFFDQVKKLNVKIAITVKTDVISTYLPSISTQYVPLADGRRIQILPDLSSLSRCKKHHFAAFILEPAMLVVWHDDPEQVIRRAEQMEQLLVAMLWRDGSNLKEYSPPGTPGIMSGRNTRQTVRKEKGDGPIIVETMEVDEEMAFYDGPRKTLLYQPILMGITATLCVLTIGVGWRRIAVEIMVDHNYIRLAFLAVVPAQLWLGWFFFQTLVNGISQMFGPVNQIMSNSKSFSGLRTRRINADRRVLPHVTVQCPVYKEGLDAVIEPTMISIRAAISTYEMQGGTANVFVNDDGLQLISAEEAQARREYFDEHNIGWVARPKHNPNPSNGEKAFVRPGKFKKASNMNYAMNVSARVEDKLKFIDRPEGWSQEEEDQAYRDALAKVIEEDQGRTWADGDIRMGDYILIIDSDTRVPEDCFLDAVSEMEQSPQGQWAMMFSI